MDEKDRVERLEWLARSSLRVDLELAEGYAQHSHNIGEEIGKLAKKGSRKEIAVWAGYVEETSGYVLQFTSHGQEVLDALGADRFGQKPMDDKERIAQLEKYAGENLVGLVAGLADHGDTVRMFAKEIARLAKKDKSHRKRIPEYVRRLKRTAKEVEKHASEAKDILDLLGIRTDPRFKG